MTFPPWESGASETITSSPKSEKLNPPAQQTTHLRRSFGVDWGRSTTGQISHLETRRTRGESEIPLKGASYLLFREGPFVSKEHQTNQPSLLYGPGRDGAGEINPVCKNDSIRKLSREKQNVLSQLRISLEEVFGKRNALFLSPLKMERCSLWGQGQSRLSLSLSLLWACGHVHDPILGSLSSCPLLCVVARRTVSWVRVPGLKFSVTSKITHPL